MNDQQAVEYPIKAALDVGSAMVKCPVCGFDYAHPVRVEVDPFVTGRKVVVTHGDSAVVDSTGHIGRGVNIRVGFDGECGHSWCLSINFHKGQTDVTVLSPDEGGIESEKNGELHMRPVIWRD